MGIDFEMTLRFTHQDKGSAEGGWYGGVPGLDIYLRRETNGGIMEDEKITLFGTFDFDVDKHGNEITMVSVPSTGALQVLKNTEYAATLWLKEGASYQMFVALPPGWTAEFVSRGS